MIESTAEICLIFTNQRVGKISRTFVKALTTLFLPNLSLMSSSPVRLFGINLEEDITLIEVKMQILDIFMNIL
jgi:hypothetical protein